MGKNWAIAIGINNYDNLQPLKYAQRDAEVMAIWFREEAKFDQIFLFTENSPPIPANPPISTQPTNARFRRFLNFQFQTPLLNPEDNLWFFFAGYGKRYNDQDYLMFPDSDPTDSTTAISVDFITQRLRRCGADNVVLLLDACRDEGSRGGLGIGEEEHQGVITFYSCNANQQSFEIDELQHGAFTYSLLEGLRLQGEGNCATVERLARHLYQRVPQLNNYYRKQIQNPYLKADPPYKMYFILLKQAANFRDAQPLIDAAQTAELEGDLLLAENLWKRLWGLPGVDDRAFEAIKRIAQKQQQSSPNTSSHSVNSSPNSSTGQRSAFPLEPISNLFRGNQEEAARRKQQDAENKRQQKELEEQRRREQESQKQREREEAEAEARRQQQEAERRKREKEQLKERKLEKDEVIRKQTIIYDVWLRILPEQASIGGELEATIYLQSPAVNSNRHLWKQSFREINSWFWNLFSEGSNSNSVYSIQVPQSEVTVSELNIILTNPGFLLNGDNTASIPLDPNITQEIQTATFRLTTLRPGNATITAELYRGDTFETKLETQIQVADIDEATFTPQRITTQPRPVPQADFILRIQAIEDETNSTYKFQYQLRSFRLPSVFSGNNVYTSSSFSSSWVEQVQGLLAKTLENISGSLPQEGKLRLASLGQYLFNHLFPTELQSDIRSLIPQNSTFTLLILTVRDISIPWELLHDGQRFFAERFIIGRWLQELSDTRPYEFPVGVVNIAHYANVEQPELWATLLAAPGAPPPQILPQGILHDSTEAMRGLHLIRYSQPADASNRRDAPVRLDNANDAEEIETKIRPAKLNLRRNRPFVTLGYVKTDVPELAELEKTWASAFIRAGCSGFTGSLWAVEASVEVAFISSFYNQLWTGASLGEAFYISCQLARAVAPDSLDWLAYVLFGDPMARPYLPVEGKGYAVVEPIGRDIDEPMPVSVPLRFRLSLRRTPPVWHEDRVMEVAEDLRFENLHVHISAAGLEITPDSTIDMNLAPTGNYLGWFTLTAPPEMAGDSALVEVYFVDGEEPIDNLIFSLEIGNEGGEIGE
jgi:uncharacterized caspase-like protein